MIFSLVGHCRDVIVNQVSPFVGDEVRDCILAGSNWIQWVSSQVIWSEIGGWNIHLVV